MNTKKESIKNKFDQKYINSISYRNQFIFVWKNITDPVLLASHFFWLPYHLFRAAKDMDAQFFIGFFMAMGNFGMIMKARADAKKTFVKNDQEIIKEYAHSD